MAIKFNTSSLSSSESNLYKIDKFNGVDYTTTPTAVDDSRAIDISNYLPEGDALVKRHGVEMLETLIVNDTEYIVLNIWKCNAGLAMDDYKDLYILYIASKTPDGKYTNFKLARNDVWKNRDFEISNFEIIKSFDKSITKSYEDIYSYGVCFEHKLFLLLQDKYLMVTLKNDFDVEEVKDHAYIPTVVIGVGAEETYYSNVTFDPETQTNVTTYEDSFKLDSKVSYLEPINLLTNTIKLELSVYKPEQTGDYFFQHYNISKFLPKGVTITSASINNTTINIGDGEKTAIDGVREPLIWAKIWNESKGVPPYERPKMLVNSEYYESYMLTYEMKSAILPSSSYTSTITIEITYTYDDGTDPSKMVEKMRFGIPYGSSGYKDRLFLSGNPEYPNIDIRSYNASFSENNWQDYAYFGDDGYCALGSSDTKIVGYGLLNNGYMAIVKESGGGQPNLFFRHPEFTEDNYGNTVETFPVISSGLALDVNKQSQVINYGNDLLVTTPNGMYKILVGKSSATQTFYANEMSYFIRNNLNRSLEKSDVIICKNKLYWHKQDVNGNYRIYVADEDRYGVVNGNQVYEWWVLDGIDTNKMFVFNDKIYFASDRGLAVFGEKFSDTYHHSIVDIEVNNQELSKLVGIDTVNNKLIVDKNYYVFTDILQSNDIPKAYKNFINTTVVNFDGYSVIETSVEPNLTIFNATKYLVSFVCSEQEEQLILSGVLDENLLMLINGSYYKYTNNESLSIQDIEDSTDVSIQFEAVVANKNVTSEYISNKLLFVSNNDRRLEYTIKDLYTIDGYAFSECVYLGDEVIYVGASQEEYVVLGKTDEVCFNVIKLKYNGLDVSFDVYSTISHVVFKFYNLIPTYWRSKYNSLGREDYLKMVDRITFVSETRRGGITNVGYRTLKNESFYEANLIRKELDFNYLEFDSFSFSKESFARTHTSKKKIKNFSFMQIAMDSNGRDDSTITSLSLRYKYTKNNKGVK